MSHHSHEHSAENKTIISFKSSFWLIIIIVGLFIAALNFIKAESGGEEEAKGEHTEKVENKEIAEPAAAPAEKAAEPATEAQPAAPSATDSAAKAAQH